MDEEEVKQPKKKSGAKPVKGKTDKTEVSGTIAKPAKKTQPKVVSDRRPGAKRQSPYGGAR